MNLSGILVVAKPQWLAQVTESLRDIQGVEMHQADEQTGRIIAVLEAEDINAEIQRLKEIKALPHVIMAEMVYHYLADDEKIYEGIPPELAEEQLQNCAVPAYLND